MASTTPDPTPHRRGQVFRYEGYDVDPGANGLTCRYSLDGRDFAERVTFPAGGRWDDPALDQAARWVFLLAGVSYYKTAAPAVVELPATPLRAAEREFLHSFYLDGLGEYAYRNQLDLRDLRIEAPTLAGDADRPATPGPNPQKRPLVPFGGGIDSIVTVELVRPLADAALFVVSRPGDRFRAIERPAAVTGLPVVRAEREIDPQVLRSRQLGFLNGHVPVTGIISAIGLVAAVLDGRDAVIMSNEWSSSIGNVEVDGRSINHQFSKSLTFEAGFRAVLARSLGSSVDYFSRLRPYTELLIADRFAQVSSSYHSAFQSCNRGFHIDPAQRLDHWCGRCDKCVFIDLILSPFIDAARLSEIFGGHEPLEDPSLLPAFEALVDTSGALKPWECVGEVDECRAAVALASQRADRAHTPVLRALTQRLGDRLPQPDGIDALMHPVGEHFVPDAYATSDLLV